MSSLKEVALFPKKRGRPGCYNFSPFKNKNNQSIVIDCSPSLAVYNSIKSSFSRWRKKHNIDSGFVFQIEEHRIVIWRRVGIN